jgi:tetratricopeptide (TPR) repeat protein
MFFEARLTPIATSPAYEPTAAAFAGGDTSAAHASAMAVAERGGPTTPADFLLVMDVCRARGEFSRSNALCRIARRRFPHDPQVTLAWARTTSIRGRDLEAIELLRPLVDHADLGALARAMMASSWGTVGARRRFRELADPLRDASDPRVRYMLGYGAASLREWDEAIEHLQYTVDHAPRWIRAVGPLCDFLLARGRVGEVEQRLLAAERSGLHDVAVDVAAFAYLSARRRWDEAVALAERAATRWPPTSLQMFAGGVALACWMLDRRDDAVHWAALVDGELAERFAAAAPARRRLLDAPLRCQERSMCLPVSVSLVCSTQGVDLDPVALYAAMEGHGGASFSKMKEAMEAHGFDVWAIQPKTALVRRMLDEGIALVGPLYGPGLAHVEVVCGYDEALDLIYVRDPESWILRTFASEALDERYREHGGLLALVRRPTTLTLAEDERAGGFSTFIAFEAAVTRGDAVGATALLEALPHGSTRMLAHWVGHGVSSSTVEVRAYERRCLADPELSPRFHAAVALQGDVTDLALTRAMLLAADADPRSWLIRMLDARLAIREGRWDDATRIVDELVQEAPSLASTWELKATIAERRGDEEGASEALDLAYDIEPTHHGITSHWRRRQETSRPFTDRLAEVEAAWRRFDSVETAWADYIGLLAAQGPDGAQVAELMAHWTKRFPKSPDAWTERMRWYAYQERADLVESVRAEASPALDMDLTAPDAIAASSEPPQHGPNEQLGLAMEQTLAGLPIAGDLAAAIEALRGRALRGELDSLLHVWLRALDFAIELARDPSLPVRPPDRLPGAPLASVRAFLERISGVSLQPRHAADLLAWIDERIPGCAASDLLLWERAALERIRGRVRDTEQLLERLVSREPAHMTALEELASLALQRGDILGAIRRFEALLRVSPGQIGALTTLVRLHELAEDHERMIVAQRRLVRRIPCQSQASERLVELTEGAALEEVRPHFDDASIRLMQARVAYNQGDYARVISLLSTPAGIPHEGDAAASALPTSLDDRQQRMRDALLLESSLALADEQPPDPTLDRLADAAVERFGDGPLFWRLRAALAIRRSDMPKFRDSIRRALVAGVFEADLATLVLDVEGPDVQRMLDAVTSAPESARGDTAMAWVDALDAQGEAGVLAEYVERCARLVPEARELRLRHAWAALARDDRETPSWIAKRLLARDAEDIDAKLLLAHASLTVDDERARSVFREVADRTGDPRAWHGLATIAMHGGDTLTARRVYWDLLRKNPLDATALAGLYTAHEPAASLGPWFRAAIERGQGAQTPYFLVHAVDVARATATKVPRRWIDVAMQRLLKSSADADARASGATSEWDLLPRAVYAFLRHLGERDALDALVQANPRVRGLRWAMTAPTRMFWPGRAWIPGEEDEGLSSLDMLLVPDAFRPSDQAD